MDDDDYRALIDVVARELREAGVPSIADERHYTEQDGRTGETRLLEPQRRLIEMLEAFDRFLAIQDRATYQKAMDNMAQSLKGAAPERATVVVTTDDGPWEIDLSEAPDLTPVREDLRRFMGLLLDADPRPEGGRF